MKYLCLIFALYLYFKIYYYADYEIKEKNNKSGGTTLKALSFLGLICILSILYLYY